MTITFSNVSAVVATNRIDGYFLTALDSLLSQTTTLLEIIVVLDGISWSGETRDTYSKHSLVILETLYPQGTPRALNIGIHAAKGQYILRLDADDIALPTRTALQVQYLNTHPQVVAIGGRVRLINSAGTSLGIAPRAPSGPLNGSLLKRNQFVHSTMMIRRDSLNAVGGYNERCLRMQDYELYLRLAQLGELHSSPSILSEYRLHVNQSSRRSQVLAPWTFAILKARHQLARHMKRSQLLVVLNNILWLSWQLLRHAQIVQPRHLSGLGGTE